MEKINFQDGQLVEVGYVEIDGVRYPIVEAKYDGATPLSSFILNKMQSPFGRNEYLFLHATSSLRLCMEPFQCRVS